MTTAFPDKKTAIIETALRLFIDRGFHGTPTAEIARESGVATGTLFHHFSSKEELVNAIYLHVKSQWFGYIAEDFPHSGSVLEQAEFAFKQTVRWGGKSPEYYYFLELFASSPYLTEDTFEEVMDSMDFIVNMLDEGQLSGLFKQVDPWLMFNMILGMMRGAIQTIVKAQSEEEVEEWVEEAYQVALAAIKA